MSFWSEKRVTGGAGFLGGFVQDDDRPGRGRDGRAVGRRLANARVPARRRLRAIVLAAEEYDGAGPVNLAASWEISMKDLAATSAEAVGYEGEVIWDASKPNGQPRRKLDVSRARE